MIAVYAAIVATAFATVRPGLFTWYFKLLLILENVGGIGGWLSKPLGGCAMCFAGQLAFWWTAYQFGWYWPNLIVNASGAILLTALLSKAYAWTQQ